MTDDLHKHINLARHLVEKGKADELEMLVLDLRWTIRQLVVNCQRLEHKNGKKKNGEILEDHRRVR